MLAPRDEYSERLNALGCDWHDLKMKQASVNPFDSLRMSVNLYVSIKSINPDVVLNFTPKNNIFGALVCWHLGIPFINNIAGLGGQFRTKSVLSLIQRLLYKVSQNKASKVYFQNEDDRATFVRCRFVPYEKTERLFGSGVDLKRFVPSPRDNDGVTRFILISRLLKKKGVEVYAACAQIIKQRYGDNVEFRIAGPFDEFSPDGISKEQMNLWVNDGSIMYLGATDMIENELSQSDVVVLPSFYGEGVPKSLLEALGMGKPVITTNNIGCRDTVNHGENGFLCEPRSVDSLIDSIEEYLKLSPTEQKKMAEASRLLAEDVFDESLIIESYMNSVSTILGTGISQPHMDSLSLS